MKFDIDMLMVYPRPTKDSPVKLTPLSILYPGVWHQSKGLDVEYFDQRFDDISLFDELVSRSKEIAVSAMTGHQCGQAAYLLKRAKKNNPKIIAGVGGHHARLMPEQVLNEEFVDKVWTGQYGLDLFPYDEKTKIHFQRTDLQYMTSTGCPFACRFCAVSEAWRPFCLDKIKEELQTIYDDKPFDRISFADPNIGFNKYKENGKWIAVDPLERISKLGKIMNDLHVTWEGNMRCPDITPQMVDVLVKANCTDLEFGCESGDEQILKNIVKKGHGVEAIKNAVRNIRGSGISVVYSFIAFMPGESFDQVKKTMDLIDWIVETDSLARTSIYNYAPYPGTPMYSDAVEGKYGYKKFIPPDTMEGWAHYNPMSSPIYWITGLNFRMDNTRKNFPGSDWHKIEPYVKLAQKKWANRDVLEFPCEEVEKLIEIQVMKSDQEYKNRS